MSGSLSVASIKTILRLFRRLPFFDYRNRLFHPGGARFFFFRFFNPNESNRELFLQWAEGQPGEEPAGYKIERLDANERQWEAVPHP